MSPKTSFKITIRDREHFYFVVKWLNEHVGLGSDKWTMKERVLRKLNNGQPTTTTVLIFADDFDAEAASLLALS